jgi:predicted phosphate transport protein (TIGR00153 family)
MRVRDLILPENKVFFSLFSEMAEIIGEAATTLNEITHELPGGTEKAQKVHQLEHKGDEITRNIYEKLNESLITPLEPEEISRLAPVLDDVLDRIDRVTQQICTYGLTEQNDKLREFSYMILLATGEIVQAFEKLPKMDKIPEIKNQANEINRLYNRAIELQSQAVLELFKTKDLLLIIKLKDIYEGLGLVMEKCNDVGHTLNDIILSHS